MSFCKWCGIWIRDEEDDHEARCPEHSGHAVVARDTFMGESQVLHRFAPDREQAQRDCRTPVSAFAFDQWGNIVASSHVPTPPAE